MVLTNLCQLSTYFNFNTSYVSIKPDTNPYLDTHKLVSEFAFNHIVFTMLRVSTCLLYSTYILIYLHISILFFTTVLSVHNTVDIFCVLQLCVVTRRMKFQGIEFPRFH